MTTTITIEPLSHEGWDDRPKGCWATHPGTRETCQLPADGHQTHKRKHPNGIELECWAKDEKVQMTPKAKLREDLKLGGAWLGAARNWLLWHKDPNGRLIWGSNDEVRMTVKEIEELALEVAIAADGDIKKARYTYP